MDLSDLSPEPDDDDDGDEEFPISTEQIQALSEQVEDAARQIGLYAMNIGAAVSPIPDPLGNPVVHLIGQFRIGKIAFAARTIDPDTDKLRDEFRAIESAMVDDDVATLRNRYGTRCAECKGKGQIAGIECPKCEGAGFTKDETDGTE